MTCVFIPISVLLLNIKQILILCKQDPVVAGHASLYINVYMSGLYLNYLANLEKKLLMNLGKNRVCLYNTLFGVIFRIFLTFMMVVVFDLKILGTGLANLLTSIVVYAHIHWYGRT
jgi:Na+-driven multidrug efflux pump